MQTISRFTRLGLAGGLALPTLLSAQSSPPLPPPAPPPPAVIEEIAGQLQRGLMEAHYGLAQAQSGYSSAAGAGVYGGGGNLRSGGDAVPPQPDLFLLDLDGARGSSEVLLLHSTEQTAEMQSELREDLAVMSRVLERAISPDLANPGKRAMGLNLMFAPGESATQSTYLEDYGVIFNLQIRFPLLPPAQKARPESSDAAVEDSEWEAARRDILGGPPSPDPFGGTSRIRSYGMDRPPAEAYNEAKVEALRHAVLAALQHGARIRHLDQDDYLLACIKGPATDPARGGSLVNYRHEVEVRGADSRNNVVVGGGSAPTPSQGTVMTLRTRYADVAAFAAGSIDLDEFRGRAQVKTYPAGSTPRR